MDDTASDADTVSTTRDGPVAVVTIDRPRVRNAVDAATAVALADAVEAADADEEVAVIVLTGAGGAFCAGADLAALTAGDRADLALADPAVGGRAPMGPTRLRTTTPTIAAIEGPSPHRWWMPTSSTACDGEAPARPQTGRLRSAGNEASARRGRRGRRHGWGEAPLARRWRAGSSWRCGATCGSRRATPSSGSSAGASASR